MYMNLEIRDLTEDNLNDHPCFRHTPTTERSIAITKDWLRKVYSKFGSCVKVAYVEGNPVAMVQYAPMDIFPHVTRPDAHETILIHCIYIADKKYEGKGIGNTLMKTLIKDLRKPHPYLKRGKFQKIMAMAGKERPGPAGPVEFFTKMGFKKVQEFNHDVLVTLEL